MPVYAAPSTAKPKKYSSEIIHVKLRQGSGVALRGSALVGAGSNRMYQIMGKTPRNTKQVFRDSKPSLDEAYRTMRAKGHEVAQLSQYIEIDLGAGADSKAVAERLRQLPEVEAAYPKPLPAPSPVTPNFVANQGYLKVAPTGLDTNFAASWPGARGGLVKIVDAEYGWNTSHEDLAKARAAGSIIAVGTPYDPFADTHHGTAVLGIMSAQNNGYGITGIAPDASLGMVNTNSSEYGWNIANAIYAAANVMNPGDVLLIEQQMWGPTAADYDFVPVEWIPEIYDAIRYATANNIIVVEPAGNGGQNLDEAGYYGVAFPGGRSDSGAIIVGAGAACGTSPSRSRLSFSTYGKRVDLQGWGECVATAGYGNFYNGGVDALYTNNFSGTSSASPVVAAAAAAYVSAYKTLNGTVPTPQAVRSALQQTGTPQVVGTGMFTGNIGPLPNLAKALLRTDLTAPTAPTSLTAKLNTSGYAALSWKPSTDNVAVAGYRLYRNGSYLRTIGAVSTYTDTSAAHKRTYQYKLQAIDKAGRTSPFSNTVTITTK